LSVVGRGEAACAGGSTALRWAAPHTARVLGLAIIEKRRALPGIGAQDCSLFVR